VDKYVHKLTVLSIFRTSLSVFGSNGGGMDGFYALGIVVATIAQKTLTSQPLATVLQRAL
jgi:hypothetical protein